MSAKVNIMQGFWNGAQNKLPPPKCASVAYYKCTPADGEESQPHCGRNISVECSDGNRVKCPWCRQVWSL